MEKNVDQNWTIGVCLCVCGGVGNDTYVHMLHKSGDSHSHMRWMMVENRTKNGLRWRAYIFVRLLYGIYSDVSSDWSSRHTHTHTQTHSRTERDGA